LNSTEVGSRELGKADLSQEMPSPHIHTACKKLLVASIAMRTIEWLTGSKAAAGARAGKLSSPKRFCRQLLARYVPRSPARTARWKLSSCGGSSRSSGPLHRACRHANLQALRSGICSPTATTPPAHARRRILEPAKSTTQRADNMTMSTYDLDWIATSRDSWDQPI
jgi:hypothetical protein